MAFCSSQAYSNHFLILYRVQSDSGNDSRDRHGSKRGERQNSTLLLLLGLNVHQALRQVVFASIAFAFGNAVHPRASTDAFVQVSSENKGVNV